MAERIACFGDSLFAGYGLTPDQALPARLEALLRARGRDVQVLNFGVSGETSAQGLRRLRRVLAAAPRICLLEFGANDSWQGLAPAELERNLEAMLAALRHAGVAVLLAGVRCLDSGGLFPARDFEDVFPRLARRHGLPLFPDILAPFADDPDQILPDGLHPNAAGAEAMALALLPGVLGLLDGPA